MRAIHRLILVLMLSVGGAFLDDAAAQELPKTIHLVVPFPPGNSADIVARTFAEHLRRASGGTVVVDNRPGASGAIALQYVATSRADGSTLLVSTLSPLVVTPATNKSLPYDTERDFAPIALLTFSDVVLIAGPATQASTMADLIALARKQPDGLTYASIGNGTLAHLVMEVITSRVGIRMRHIPYKGSAQAYIDLIGGEVTVMVDGMPQLLSQIKAGKFKPLVILSKSRSPFLNTIPTIAETNLPPLQNIEAVGWTGLLAPAGTPRAIVAQLNAATTQIYSSTEMREILAGQSLQPFPVHTPEYFANYMRSELANWRAVAKAAGVEGSQ